MGTGTQYDDDLVHVIANDAAVTNTGNTATDPDIATEFVILGANGRLELAGEPW